jgi:RNA polymerase sigma-70 factor (ECF subfamily)
MRPSPALDADASREGPWLAAFQRGDRDVLEACYRTHFAAVERAIGTVLSGADRETVIHEVFTRLLGNAELRGAFQGGSLVAWLGTVARNQAIDYQRRLGREMVLRAEGDQAPAPPWHEAAEARVLVDRFRREHLRPDWDGVFELRFLQQMTQHEASRALGVSRTTLAYREMRIRSALRAFLLEDETP